MERDNRQTAMLNVSRDYSINEKKVRSEKGN